MRTVLDILPPESRENQQLQSMRIAQAYAALFTGVGGIEDAEIVLVDMATFTRYYDTAMLHLPAEQVKALDQRRAVFQRIMEAMTLSGEEPKGLHGAVLRAPPIDNIEER